MRLLTIGRTIISPPWNQRSVRLGSGLSRLSMISLSRMGLTTPMLTVSRISPVMIASRIRYGRKKPAIRRSVAAPVPGRAFRFGSGPPPQGPPRRIIGSCRGSSGASSVEHDGQEGLRHADPLRLADQPRPLAHLLRELVASADLAGVAEQRLEARLERVGHVDPQVRLLDAGEQDLAPLPRLEALVARQLGEVQAVARRRVNGGERRLPGGEVVGMSDERVVVESPLRVLGDHEVGPEAADLARDVAPQAQRRRQVPVRIVEMDDLGDAQNV